MNGDFLWAGWIFATRPKAVCQYVMFVQGLLLIAPERTGPICTRQTPKDAPKRRNDDGVCHVAPRATWHVPRAAARTLSKTILAGQSGRKKCRRDTKLSG